MLTLLTNIDFIFKIKNLIIGFNKSGQVDTKRVNG